MYSLFSYRILRRASTFHCFEAAPCGGFAPRACSTSNSSSASSHLDDRRADRGRPVEGAEKTVQMHRRFEIIEGGLADRWTRQRPDQLAARAEFGHLTEVPTLSRCPPVQEARRGFLWVGRCLPWEIGLAGRVRARRFSALRRFSAGSAAASSSPKSLMYSLRGIYPASARARAVSRSSWAIVVSSRPPSTCEELTRPSCSSRSWQTVTLNFKTVTEPALPPVLALFGPKGASREGKRGHYAPMAV